ncbi:MAG: hypothetical protein Q4G43_15430, partial [Mobilicoccus sp.]|nr:hypothetical protein [Mobilicoccus sp.]
MRITAPEQRVVARPEAPVVRGAAWVAMLAVVVSLVAHLSRVGWGLDRTDEGQYLLLLNDPEVSRSTVFLFGYVLHPVYQLVGGDITVLRVVGILGCVAAAAVLGVLAARLSGLSRAPGVVAAVVVAGFGLGPTLYFPLTPSYNTLAFWGVALWGAGLLAVAASRAGVLGLPIAGPVMMGLGGVVAFSGKATSGAALAVLTIVVALVMVVSSADRRRSAIELGTGIGAGAAVGLMTLMAVVGHGPGWFVDFYRDGARSVALLQGHDELVRWDSFSMDGVFAVPTVMAFVATCVAMSFARRASVFGWVFVAVQLAVTAGVVAMAVLRGGEATGSPVMLLGWWLIPVVAVIAVTQAPSEDALVAARDRVLLVAVFALLPLVYVVGTNGNYWIAQARGAVFWVVAGLLLLGGRPAHRAVFTA